MTDPLLPSKESGACALCGREVGGLTRHHLRPRSEGGKHTAWFCSGCHRQIHALYSNQTLAAEYDTLEKLREDPQVRRYLAWIRKQSDRRIQVRRSRGRR